MEDQFRKISKPASLGAAVQVDYFTDSIPRSDSNVEALSRIKVKTFTGCYRRIVIVSRFLSSGAGVVDSLDVFIPKLRQHPIVIKLSLV